MSTLNSFLTAGASNAFTSLTAVSTTPAAGKFHVVGSFIISNISANAVNITATVQRSAVDYSYVTNFPLQAGDSLFLHGLLGKVVLLAGDVLRVKSSVANSIDVEVSIAEEP
jgi:hypothetical protein